jgi:hypothetical protein
VTNRINNHLKIPDEFDSLERNLGSKLVPIAAVIAALRGQATHADTTEILDLLKGGGDKDPLEEIVALLKSVQEGQRDLRAEVLALSLMLEDRLPGTIPLKDYRRAALRLVKSEESGGASPP